MEAEMTGSERRLDKRVAIDMFLNQYIKEQPYRALAVNLSETGLLVQKLVEPVTRHARVIAVEFELPGTNEIIWAKAESRFEALDEDFHTTGVHFLAMARKHERLVRDWVYDKQKRDLDSLWHRFRLARLTRPLA
jgi:c-di-GMP-binding flagellar brake protein YcgR